MLINKGKKLFFYEVDPLFFYDGNNDGFGDFIGFIKKNEYLKFLNIDVVIFPDIFNQEEFISKPYDLSLYDKYGKNENFRALIEKLIEIKKDLALEINLTNISNSKIARTMANDSSSSIYNNEEEDKENWVNQKNIAALRNIVEFWTKNGVHNFVINDFEDTYEESNNSINKLIFEMLGRVYKEIKTINPHATIILKSNKLNRHDFLSLNSTKDKCYDYIIDASFSKIGTHDEYQENLITNFNALKFYKKIFQKNKYINSNDQYVLALSTKLVGRINSRWGSEEVYHKVSGKTLMLLNLFTPYSSLLFYGDEIGTLRTIINNDDRYFDHNFEEKKEIMIKQHVKESKIHYSKSLLDKISSQNLFSWNDTKNGGFSNEEISYFRKTPKKYKQINVKSQWSDEDSILHFVKKIIDFQKESVYSDFFNSNESVVKYSILNKSLLKVTIKLNGKKIISILNLSDNKTPYITFKKYKKIIFTHSNDNFKKGINWIKPFESIVFVKEEKSNENKR